MDTWIYKQEIGKYEICNPEKQKSIIEFNLFDKVDCDKIENFYYALEL